MNERELRLWSWTNFGGPDTYAHDRSDRLTSIDYSDATPDTAYSYDPASNRASMVDGTGTTQYTYDNAGNLASVAKGTDQFTYAHDLAGNITNRTWPGGIATDYTHDDDGNVATATTQTNTTTYAWDPTGRLLSRTLPTTNGYTEALSYDAAGRLESIESTNGATSPLVTSKVTRDAAGSPLRTVTTDTIETYAYDDAGRLTAECYQPIATDPNATSSLTASGCLTATTNKFTKHVYDGVGNRTQLTNNDGTSTFTYNAADELTSRVSPGGTTSYSHDQNGNRTSAGTTTMTYDLANRMVEHYDGTTATQYTYDGDGKRTATTTGTTTTDALWDIQHPNAQLALERSAATGTTLRRYSYGTGERTTMHTSAGAFYYHYDPLGSVSALTDASGAAQHLYAYEGFGQQRAASTAPGAPENQMRFAGEQLDATGLYHLRARQYDPGTGRFTAEDPVAWPVGMPFQNTYQYAFNNPTSFVDPSGRFGESGWLAQHPNINAALHTPGAIISDTKDRMSETSYDAAGAGRGMCGDACAFGGAFLGGASGFLGMAELMGDADQCANGDWRTGTVVPKPRSDAQANSRLDNCLNAGLAVGSMALGGVVRAAGTTRASRPASSCAKHSFVPQTKVLMSDRTWKPISSVRVGDFVAAGNVTTGTVAGRRVEHVLSHVDKSGYVELRMAGGSITATAHHPVWNNAISKWQRIDTLGNAARVRTVNGDHHPVSVISVNGPSDHLVYDLTVAQDHTYFVKVGTASMLVHNTDCSGWAAKHFKDGDEVITFDRKFPDEDPFLGRPGSGGAREGYHDAIYRDGLVTDRAHPNGIPLDDYLKGFDDPSRISVTIGNSATVR